VNGAAEPPRERPGRVAWLVLAYRLPARPGLKATIRRRLAAAGAVNLANAVAAVPASPAAERSFRRLRSIIGEAGGSAQVLRAAVIEGGAGLAGAFNAARDQEYGKVIAGCADLVGEIGDLTAAGCFRYADLAEKDAELNRLSARYEATRALDVLGAPGAGQAQSALATCRAVLDTFARRVDQAETASAAEPRSRWPASRLPAPSH
jgi:hypothetical protein